MSQSVEQLVARYQVIAEKIRREDNTPEKARARLIKAGILERNSKSRNGVRLAKRFR